MKLGTVAEKLVDTMEEIRGFSCQNVGWLVKRGLDEQLVFSPMKLEKVDERIANEQRRRLVILAIETSER